MIKALDSAGSALASSFQRLDKSAARVANQDADADPVREVVEQIRAKHEAQAAAAVIKTEDEMKGTLIDIFA